MWTAPGIWPSFHSSSLADVDEERRVDGLEELAGAARVDLVDLGSHLLQAARDSSA